MTTPKKPRVVRPVPLPITVLPGGETVIKISPRTMLLLLGVTLIVSEPHALAHIDVTVQQARELIESTNDLTVVDVREPYEYCDAKGHISGALNYPWNSGLLRARYEELPTDGPILVVCRSGGRSNAAASFLDSKGFSEVYDMLRGMNAWQWETAGCKYSGGAGTADDPYQIATAADLIALGERPEDYDRHFVLTADIDLDPNLPGSKVFDKAAIAPDTNGAEDGFQGIPFAGSLDGNGHTISRLTITGRDYVGLFGYLAFGADIKALSIVDVDVSGSGGEIGALVGNNDGDVTNCHSGATVSGLEGVGGLIGGNYGVVSKCHSAAVVWSAERVGGLMGRNSGVVIACYSTGTVSGTWQAGGLLGVNNGIVTNCYSTATVYGDAGLGPWLDESVFGGLTACNLGEITNCYATGSVSGRCYVGGLVGRNWRSMSNCYSTATISGDSDVGGLVGSGGDEANCFWDTEASGLADSGGTGGLNAEAMGDVQTYLDAGWDFFGEIQNGSNETWQMPEGGGYPVLSALNGYVPPQLPGQGTAEDPYLISAATDLGTVYYNPGGCYKLVASVDLSGIEWSAAALPAFAGVFDGNGHTIEKLTISGKGLIGLFGWLQKGSQVKNLGVVDANVVGVDYENGILAGCSLGSVTNCYSSGYIQASGYVGGLIGNNERGAVADCHSTAFVRGGGDVGGLIGRNLDGTVDNCHSTGSVEGLDVNDTVGGLIGSNQQQGNVSNSYSTGVVCGIVSDGDGRRWGSVGGLVGANTYGRLIDCHSTSTVTGDNNVGGLVGRNGISGWGPGLAGIVANCCSTGEVSGNTSVGGLLGCNEKGRIDNCYSTAAVSGDTQVGGLGGRNQDSISNCYSTGAVAGNTDVGGLLGHSRGDVTDSFWDIETSSLTSSVGGTGKTTSEMQTPDTFLEAGWDLIDETANGIDDIWWILQGQDYPRLWWEVIAKN